MIRASALALGLALGTGAAGAGDGAAETVRIRAGDHVGFSRLVLPLAGKVDWRFGRVEGGYALEFPGADLTFDLGQVYQRIGRDRIASLRQDAESGRLVLGIDCDCSATASVFGSGWIVIDVASGPAPAASKFEAPLGPAPRRPGGVSEAVAAPSPAPAAGVSAAPPGFAAGKVRPLPVWAGDSLRVLPPVAPAPGSAAGAIGTDSAARERLGEQETLLLKELARAAAQGLLEADLPALDRARNPPQAPPGAAGAPPALAARRPEDFVRLDAETSIDRETGYLRPDSTITPDGLACLADSYFDLQGWGGAGAPGAALAERRNALVGEFDRPDPAAVLALARYYLFLGFGAEAKATITAFGADLPPAGVVMAIASVLDGDPGGLPGVLAGQSDCDGRAALWSILAESGPAPGARPNNRAILAAFSALPLHLRRHLGPDLAERYLAAGDREMAIALRDAIARAPGEHGAEFDLLNARLALSEGDASAPARFEALAGSDGTVAPEAYADFLAGELDAGRVPENGPDTAAALGFEIAGTEAGDRLALLALRAVLAKGDFEAGRQEILRLEAEGRLADPALWAAFAEALAQGARDALFLRQSYAARDAMARAELPEAAATALANRLTGLGFPEEALRYLPEDVASEPAAIARAEAFLAAGAPAAAFGALGNRKGADAERLRAQALVALGDARGAAERFGAAGDPVRAERTAWNSGAWDLLARSEDQAVRRLARERDGTGPAKTVEPASAEVAALPPAGRVERARSVLDAVRARRGDVESILASKGRSADPS